MNAIVALVLALAAAWIPGGKSTSQSGLIVLLATDGPVRIGQQPATFTLVVDNPGGPADVTFPSGQLYDITVLSGETEVWRWSTDRFFTMALQQRTFSTGVTLVERVPWDGRDNAGNILPPGTYRAMATLTTMSPITGNAVEIIIEAPAG